MRPVEPGDVTPDVHVIGLAVLDMLRALARDGPLVVAIDDVQWLDSASAGVLQVALRRLRDEPVGLLATVREAPGLSAPIDLELCFSPERLRRLPVGPVGMGALHRLLRDRLGLDLSRPDLVRLQKSHGGTRSSRSRSAASSSERTPARRRVEDGGWQVTSNEEGLHDCMVGPS